MLHVIAGFSRCKYYCQCLLERQQGLFISILRWDVTKKSFYTDVDFLCGSFSNLQLYLTRTHVVDYLSDLASSSGALCTHSEPDLLLFNFARCCEIVSIKPPFCCFCPISPSFDDVITFCFRCFLFFFLSMEKILRKLWEIKKKEDRNNKFWLIFLNSILLI